MCVRELFAVVREPEVRLACAKACRLRLRAKRNTVQGSPLMGIRRRGFVKSGVAMLILEV
jgi:hypothetical protein